MTFLRGDKLAALAAQAVARRIAVIVSMTAVATVRAIKALAGTIPIVSTGPEYRSLAGPKVACDG
jgi:hypothetical protein